MYTDTSISGNRMIIGYLDLRGCALSERFYVINIRESVKVLHNRVLLGKPRCSERCHGNDHECMTS